MYSILDKVNGPDDVKKLNLKETYTLSTEISDFLVESVSKTGGHLSSNLGVVELTLALHKVFDSSKDRFIFDVGHQAYVHKILTGRRENFATLRKKDGMSGFTKPSESDHDAFISGHASISISVALGMAHARTIQKEKHSIIAIIGDGALTGGLAYEALNNAGSSKEPLIVILNDNRMSITENVGAMSKYLSKLRTNSKYLRTKQRLRTKLERTEVGKKIFYVINGIKRRIKMTLIEISFFEQMGFSYLGPVDGHNIKAMCDVLEYAKSQNKPTFIHVITKKGKGYKYSEDDPEAFHGVGAFNADTGNTSNSKKDSFSSNFGEIIVDLAEKNEKICAITPAMSLGTGLSDFREKYPNRFYDVGIAESHAVTMSAGLAKAGLIPICAMYSTFLQRAYDQLIHDVSIMNLHVVFAIDRAGIVGEDGETHNGVFDVPMLLSIPNFKIFAPSNFIEQENMLKKAILEFNSPVVVRYPRGFEGEFLEDTSNDDYKIYNENGKICVITYGMLINNILSFKETHNICIVKINNLTMNLDEIIDKIMQDKVIILEDCVNTGSLGQKISSKFAEKNKNINFLKLLNTGDNYTKQATVEQVYSEYNLTKDGILKIIQEALN